jgi:hypothetical protein
LPSVDELERNSGGDGDEGAGRKQVLLVVDDRFEESMDDEEVL